MEKKEIVPKSKSETFQKNARVDDLLDLVRPAWQAKGLIERVRRLIKVDPSSACQRLFNAAIHDLKEKIMIAGIDIAKESARQNKLPPIEKNEDIENYSTSNVIDLAYHIGLLSHPAWRRVSRCYDIRRDLEHEDDQYEAGIEDCIYIFKTCIEAVLASDPVQLLRVEDVKDIVEQPSPVFPSPSLLEDYERAPVPRQEEILQFLISISLDSDKPDIVRQNAYNMLTHIKSLTQNSVKLSTAQKFQKRIIKSGMDDLHIRVANAADILAYIDQKYLRDHFESISVKMEKTGCHWSKYADHGEILRSFKEAGSFFRCPARTRPKIINWMIRTYIGEEGGMTSYGHVRPVFFSDTAAPLIEQIVKENARIIIDDIKTFKPPKNQLLARRYESLIDLCSLREGS